jgi:hypothetical protein
MILFPSFLDTPCRGKRRESSACSAFFPEVATRAQLNPKNAPVLGDAPFPLLHLSKIASLAMTNKSTVGCPSYSLGQLHAPKWFTDWFLRAFSGLADRTPAAEEDPK